MIFQNGSYFEVFRLDGLSKGHIPKGHRFNGIIIDEEIDSVIVNSIIRPSMFIRNDMKKFMASDLEHILIISQDDVIEINKYENKYRRRRNNFMNEYYLSSAAYDHPVITKELNDQKVMLYEAWGIPKDNIRYKTEFINRSKQTYLNIEGRHEIKDLGYENDLNVRLLIDTDIYDGYKVMIENGMVTVILHEVKNEAPSLIDYAVE